MDNRTQRQKRAQSERQRALKFQRTVRAAAIVLAIVLALISLGQSCSTRKAIEDLAAQIRAKKLAQAQEELLALQPSPSPEATPAPASEGVQITLSFVGDVAMGTDDAIIERGEGGDLFAQFYDNYGEDYFFENVKSIFEGDHLTTASLVSNLTLQTDARYNWNPAYRAEPYYGDILAVGGIDAVTVANYHTYDYDYEGYVDTLANLDNSGVGRFGYENVLERDLAGHPADQTRMVQVGNIKVGYVGVYEKADDFYEDTALENIKYLRDEGAQIVIVEVAWTSEDPDKPDDNKILKAHKFIDNGADLVVGIQPDILQGIECYHDKYIVYSLGTFLSCAEEPVNMDSMIFQQTFTIVDGQVQPQADYEIIPCLISSQPKNNCQPTPAKDADAQRVLDRIYDCSAILDGGVSPQ